jgi:hypothetical protein
MPWLVVLRWLLIFKYIANKTPTRCTSFIWFDLIILQFMYALFMMQIRHIKWGNLHIMLLYHFEYYNETHSYSFWAEGEKHLPFFSCTSKHVSLYNVSLCLSCLRRSFFVISEAFCRQSRATLSYYRPSSMLYAMIMMILKMSNECLYECKEWCDEICGCMTRTHTKPHPDSASP